MPSETIRPELIEESRILGGLTVKKLRLPNGLNILLLVDPSAPVFSYHSWFRVGSKHEKEGTTGIAHLFEHLMFKATKNRKDGEFDKWMEAHGAQTNAATWTDWTYYRESLGKNDLATTIELEADRMVNLILNEKQVESERGVVINERRLSVDNSLMGTMSEKLWSSSFTVHPYHWPTIGWLKDIQAISLDDCMRFYRTFYAPNNATVVVVGDVDEAGTLALIARHYGHIEAQEIPRTNLPAEPAPRGEQRQEMSWPTASAKILLGYRVGSYLDPSAPAVEAISVLLAGGHSSRLYRKLVLDSGLCSDVSAFVSPFAHPGLMEIALTVKEGAAPDAALELLDAEVERLVKDGITDSELEKARSTMATDFYRHLRTTGEKAYTLGFYETISGDFKNLLEHARRTEALTRGQIEAAARAHLDRSGRSLVIARPKSEGDAKAGGDGADGDSTTAATRQGAGAARRGPGAAPAAGVARQTLPGGGVLLFEVNRDLPICSLEVLLCTGALADPHGQEGLAMLTADCLLAGAAGMSREELAEALEGLGASLDATVEQEFTMLSGHVLTRHLPAFTDLLAKVIGAPALAPSEVERQKGLQVERILSERDEDRTLVRRFFRRHLFGEHPLGRSPVGSVASVKALDADAVRRFYGDRYRRGPVVAAVAGDHDPDAVADLMARLVSALPEGTLARPGDPVTQSVKGRRLLIADKPDRTQNHFAIGHLGIPASHPDYFALLLGVTAFGGTFTSRLMEEVRNKRGWTYGAHAILPRSRRPDAFFMTTFTQTPDTAPAVELCLSLFESLIKDGITDKELEAAKGYLDNEFAFKIDTPEKRVMLAVEALLKELGDDWFAHYRERVRAPSLAQVNAALRTHLQSTDLALAMVATAADVRPTLDALQCLGSITVVPFDQ